MSRLLYFGYKWTSRVQVDPVTSRSGYELTRNQFFFFHHCEVHYNIKKEIEILSHKWNKIHIQHQTLEFFFCTFSLVFEVSFKSETLNGKRDVTLQLLVIC